MTIVPWKKHPRGPATSGRLPRALLKTTAVASDGPLSLARDNDGGERVSGVELSQLEPNTLLDLQTAGPRYRVVVCDPVRGEVLIQGGTLFLPVHRGSPEWRWARRQPCEDRLDWSWSGHRDRVGRPPNHHRAGPEHPPPGPNRPARSGRPGRRVTLVGVLQPMIRTGHPRCPALLGSGHPESTGFPRWRERLSACAACHCA